jgi:hypothetical protein
MTLPNFLILGAPKCGTTSLYSYVAQHPDVFMCFPKEPTFFGHEDDQGLFNGPGDNNEIYRTRVVTSFEAYTTLFSTVTTQKAIGEASTFYLYLPKAPLTIKKYIPHAQMFAVLRNPADRAYSNYLHLARQLRETLSFAEALREESNRIRNNFFELWHYKSMGFYYEQVKRYYDMFGRQQVRIYLHEDLQENMLSVVQEIFGILGIDPSFVPNMSKKWNVGYMPKSPLREKVYYKLKHATKFCAKHAPWRLRSPIEKSMEFIAHLERPVHVPRPPMPQEVRAALLEEYRDDILKLQDLLRRDLTHWLSSVPATVSAD